MIKFIIFVNKIKGLPKLDFINGIIFWDSIFQEIKSLIISIPMKYHAYFLYLTRDDIPTNFMKPPKAISFGYFSKKT